MLVKLMQSENALAPIVVTLSGMMTSVRLEQPRNALSPILIAPSGMVYAPDFPFG